MAYLSVPSFILPILLITLLPMNSNINMAGARHLLEIPKPEMPNKVELPPFPKPVLPELPIPELPEIPELPHIPELPAFPHLPELPKLTLPAIPTLPEQTHSTANP